MGYGEVGGGGSVHWKVEHGGNTKRHGDFDPRPAPDEGGQFIVKIKAADNMTSAQARTTFDPDGTVTITCGIDHSNKKQIRIFWTP